MGSLIGFAFEEDEVVDAPVADDTAALISADAEGQPEVDAINETQTMVDDGISQATTLDAIGDSVESTLEDGGEGLTEDAAEIAEIAVESICARLGFKQRVMPAMESFGSVSSRRVATRIALEGIWDRVKKVWEAIKAAFVKLWEHIKQFFVNIINVVKVGRETAAKLAARLEKIKNGKYKVGTKEITANGVLTAFSINGKADVGTVKSILESSTKALGSVAALQKETGDMVKTFAGGVKSMIESLSAGESKSDNKKSLPDAAAIYSKFASQLGTVQLVRGLTAKIEVTNASGNSSAKLVITQPKKADAAKSVKVPQVSELQSVLVDVQTLSDALTANATFEKSAGVLKKDADSSIDEIITLLSAQERKDDHKNGGVSHTNHIKTMNEARVFINTSVALTTSTTSRLVDYAKTAMREALIFVSAAADCYEEVAGK